jgi:DNA-binding MarR family transcriptional regulator
MDSSYLQLARITGPLRRELTRAVHSVEGLPDLPESQVEALRALSEDGPMTSSALATSLGLARSTVSNLVHAMEKSGLLERSLSRSGSRVELAPSRKAAELLHRWDLASNRCIEQALDSMQPEQRSVLIEAIPVLQELVNHLESQT